MATSDLLLDATSASSAYIHIMLVTSDILRDVTSARFVFIASEVISLASGSFFFVFIFIFCRQHLTCNWIFLYLLLRSSAFADQNATRISR